MSHMRQTLGLTLLAESQSWFWQWNKISGTSFIGTIFKNIPLINIEIEHINSIYLLAEDSESISLGLHIVFEYEEWNLTVFQERFLELECYLFIYFLRFYWFIFREGKGERKRERNIDVWLALTGPLLGTWPAVQAWALG